MFLVSFLGVLLSALYFFGLIVKRYVVVAVVLMVSACGDGINPAPAGKSIAPVAVDNFDFRGVRLGITRGEFKLIKSPPVVAPGSPVWKLLTTCSNDPDSRRTESPYYEKRQTQSDCWWEYDTGKKSAKSWERYSRANVVVGADEDDDYRFKFAALPNDADQRLYAIELSFPSQSWRSVMEAISEKFGSPVADRVSYANSSGIEVPADSYVWDRSESSIRLTKNVAQHNVGTVTYVLKKYSLFVYEQDKKLAGGGM